MCNCNCWFLWWREGGAALLDISFMLHCAVHLGLTHPRPIHHYHWLFLRGEFGAGAGAVRDGVCYWLGRESVCYWLDRGVCCWLDRGECCWLDRGECCWLDRGECCWLDRGESAVQVAAVRCCWSSEVSPCWQRWMLLAETEVNAVC